MEGPTATLTLAHADAFAAAAHSGQTRKNLSQSPFVIHPRGVLLLLDQAGVTDIHTLVAARLRNTVEDTPVTSAQIEQEFGVEIAKIVVELTDSDHGKSMTRDARYASTMSLPASCIDMADRTYKLEEFYVEKPEKDTVESVRDYAAYSYTLCNKFKERAEAEIENKSEEARCQLEKAYLLLLAKMDVAVRRLTFAVKTKGYMQLLDASEGDTNEISPMKWEHFLKASRSISTLLGRAS
jgi:(p)ppGpp synthase/HD superfamily hydrolase